MAPFLKKTDFYDERLDPWLSTDAALSKLQDNYKMFNDWSLAIAAYNCGAGAMKRQLKKAKVKTFWYLAEHKLLSEETINYVPKLIAVSEIAGHGGEYNVLLPEMTESQIFADYDYIITKKTISLSRLASELRMDFEILKQLNTALIHEKTPPYEYKVRLPAGKGSAAAREASGIF